MHVTAHAPLQRQPFFRHSLGPPVGDPILDASPSTARSREIDAAARSPNDVFQATRLPFDPGSPSRRPTWRSFGARASRTRPEKEQAKAHAYSPALFSTLSAEGLSLSGGA